MKKMNGSLNTLSKIKEQVNYKNREFPLAIFYDHFDSFVNNAFYCHWHDEIELAVVLKGSVKYLLNQTSYTIEEGDGLLIGARSLHSAKQVSEHSVVFNILFPANILNRMFNNFTFHKYASQTSDWLHINQQLSQDVAEEKEVLDSLRNIEHSLSDRSNDLAQAEAILHIWRYLPEIFSDLKPTAAAPPSVREERMRSMITYIQNNYMHHITAATIAASANISRSECFRCFSLFGESSPVDYLNRYRLHIAAKKLVNSNESISNISLSCGFSSTSYFSKTFKDNFGISPMLFRKEKNASRIDLVFSEPDISP